MEEVSSPGFIQAISSTVSYELGVPLSSVTEVVMRGHTRRVLLSSVTVSYLVTVTSGRTPDSYVAVLKAAVADGDFLAVLSSESGLSITSSTDLVVTDISPTSHIHPGHQSGRHRCKICCSWKEQDLSIDTAMMIKFFFPIAVPLITQNLVAQRPLRSEVR